MVWHATTDVGDYSSIVNKLPWSSIPILLWMSLPSIPCSKNEKMIYNFVLTKNIFKERKNGNSH